MTYLQLAQQLADEALASGVVLTMTTEPKQPLAMGNYTIKVEARPTRHAPQFCSNCDAPLPGDCSNGCALLAFDLDAMCKAAMQRVESHIMDATLAHWIAIGNESHSAMRAMHQRHDFYLHRARLFA